MFAGITDLPTFILGTVFIVLLPGPNSLYVMTVASRYGVGAGYRGAAGIFTGDAILMLLAATGAASLLKGTPALFLVLKGAGALYLAWLGIGLLRAGWRLARGRAEEGAAAPVEAARPFRTALIISLVNPKAILYYVSFFIQFVRPGYPYPGLAFLILALIVQFFSVLYLAALIHGGAGMAGHFRRRRWLAALGTGGTGLLFLAFGLKLGGASPIL